VLHLIARCDHADLNVVRRALVVVQDLRLDNSIAFAVQFATSLPVGSSPQAPKATRHIIAMLLGSIIGKLP